MTEEFITEKQHLAAKTMRDAGIAVTAAEENNIEICDYDLGRYDEIGTAILIYVNTERCCGKEMVLEEGQLCPEHYHPPLPQYGYPGKEETFRCRKGIVWLYVEGESTANPGFQVPADKKDTFTVWHEIRLTAGEQYTLKPNTKHWFAAGRGGAVISEFSTPSFDLSDVFTDPAITRISNISER